MTERDELLNLIKCAIEFCNLAAGEGISIDNLSPEDFLLDYSGATGYEDWCTISDYVIDQIMRDGREIERLTAESQRLRATLSALTATDCYSRDECTAMARAALNEEK